MAMILFAIRHTLIYGPNTLLRPLTPSFAFGSGPEDYTWSPPPTVWGDEDAKMEARRMIQQFEVERKKAVSQVEQDGKDDPSVTADITEEEIPLAAFPAPFN